MIKISTYIKVFFFIFIILVSNSLFAKKAAIVMDYETKEVLFEVNAHPCVAADKSPKSVASPVDAIVMY